MTTHRFGPVVERPSLRHTLRVVVVDDHPLTRRGITDVVNESSGMRVCGEAGSVAGAIAVIEATRPNLATVDLSLGAESGLTLIAAITARHPEVR